MPTEPGRYDEIGSSEGVVGFGTHFWIKVHVDREWPLTASEDR